MKYKVKIKANVVKLRNEITISSIGSKLHNIYIYGDDVMIETTAALTTAEQAILDTIMTNHDPIDIDAVKEEKNLLIDAKTNELIKGGFEFDGNMFSMSSDAQRNWMGLHQFKEYMDFPIKISTLDDGEYSLHEEHLVQFVLKAVGTVEYYLSSGRKLKVKVKKATTIDEINAIEDNRVMSSVN